MGHSDLLELRIAEDIKRLVEQEVKRLVVKPELDKGDFAILEKLAKTYSMMMADFRESLKAGLFGQMGEQGLEELTKESPEPQSVSERSQRGRKPTGYQK
jgi:hypothetical protein